MYLSDLSVVATLDVVITLKEDVAEDGLAKGVVLIVKVVEALEGIVRLQ